LETVREKTRITYKGKPIKKKADFSTETLKEGHGVKYLEHCKKIISVLGYSMQQSYHSKLIAE
jgi:hypothetical protein